MRQMMAAVTHRAREMSLEGRPGAGPPPPAVRGQVAAGGLWGGALDI